MKLSGNLSVSLIDSPLFKDGMRYRDPKTGTFLTKDPKGFVNGPNLYTYVNQNPWSRFDPEGLEIKFFTLEKSEDGKTSTRVPYKPTAEQLRHFNNAINELREKGGDLGQAMANALESTGDHKVTYEITHAKGTLASSFPAEHYPGTEPSNPSMDLDLDSRNFTNFVPDPFDTPRQQQEKRAKYEKEVSKNPAIVLGHEMGHVMTPIKSWKDQAGLRDPENVTAVENVLRSRFGEPPRETYGGKPVPVKPESSARNIVEQFQKEWTHYPSKPKVKD